MSRIFVVLLIGIGLAIGGCALMLGAPGLATSWQSLGPNSWGGETDLTKEWVYREMGFVILAFGLVLAGLASFQWLNTSPTDRVLRQTFGSP